MSQFKLLKDAKIKFISLVNKGANKRKFALKKSDDSLEFSIIKSDKKDWSVVKGVVYEPDVFDTHNHKMTAEEIEKMAHYALENGLSVDIEHNEKITSNPVVESYIVEKDEELNGQIIKKGSWVAGVKIKDEEVRKAVDEGKINCFSMAGKAILEDIEKAEQTENKPFYSTLLKFAEFLEETFNDSEMTDIQKKDDIVFNLAQFEDAILNDAGKMLNINKSDKEAEMPELTKQDIVDIVKSTMKEVEAEKASQVEKSEKEQEIADLKKTVKALEDKILKSEAGKDGEEIKKKEDFADQGNSCGF